MARNLEALGFHDDPLPRKKGWKSAYDKYLDSPLWKKIRQEAMVHRCHACICGALADEVHHYSYARFVLEGTDDYLRFLFPICKKCHDLVHWPGGDRSKPKYKHEEMREAFRNLYHELKAKFEAETQPKTLLLPLPKRGSDRNAEDRIKEERQAASKHRLRSGPGPTKKWPCKRCKAEVWPSQLIGSVCLKCRTVWCPNCELETEFTSTGKCLRCKYREQDREAACAECGQFAKFVVKDPDQLCRKCRSNRRKKSKRSFVPAAPKVPQTGNRCKKCNRVIGVSFVKVCKQCRGTKKTRF